MGRRDSVCLTVEAVTEPGEAEYQYYEFLAVDRPLTAAEQDEVREFSGSAKITATGFSNEYYWGDFRGDPEHLMRRYYDAHQHLTSWGTHRVMLRLPRALLDPETAGRYCVDDRVSVSVTDEHVIIDMLSEDEEGDEDGEDSLPAIVGVRAELAAGDLRPLYLAWLSAYGAWERDEEAFGEEDEDELEPPVPAGLRSLTAAQRALAGFLRLDADLLEVAAEASPPGLANQEDVGALAARIAGLPVSEKDRLLLMVAQDQGARVKMELLQGLGGNPANGCGSGDRRTVGALLDAAAMRRQ
jgi:hypothetical protein